MVPTAIEEGGGELAAVDLYFLEQVLGRDDADLLGMNIRCSLFVNN
jgi:hypothetical protein